jgi:citrate synthase
MRRRRGLEPIAPHSHMNYAQNFLYMCFGDLPEQIVVDAFEQSMVLYAEHSFNASTFAARVVTSTQSDIYSAVTAAIGALKGSLHGGANEAVMRDMIEIGTGDKAAQWLQGRLSRRNKIMGFGHRVYKNGDSRVPTMKHALERVAATRDGQRWLDIYEVLEKGMAVATGIKPNLDFPTGPAYHLIGFDITCLTPISVMSRITGWTAHINGADRIQRADPPAEGVHRPTATRARSGPLMLLLVLAEPEAHTAAEYRQAEGSAGTRAKRARTKPCGQPRDARQPRGSTGSHRRPPGCPQWCREFLCR